MKYTIRFLVLIFAVVTLSGVLPMLFEKAFNKRADRPNIMYSPVIKDFVYSVDDRSGGRKYYDAAGNDYEAREYTKLLPLIYFRDLQKWGVYPEVIGGEYISVEKASKDLDYINFYPKWIDGDKRRIQLFPMFESESGFSKLELPSDLFRITSRMEFVDCVSNSVNEEKSAAYTTELVKKGFVFPPKMIAGNPTTKKSYDFGYFVQDANNDIYHIVQVKGVLKVTKTDIKPDGNVLYISVRENYEVPYYGFLVTANGGVYHIMKDGYSLNKLPLDSYKPLEQSFRFMRDSLNMLVKIADSDGERAYALDRNYNVEKTYYYKYEKRISGFIRTVYDVVFPFKITTSDSNKSSESLNIKFSDKLPEAFIFSAILACLFAAWRIFSGRRKSLLPFDVALILVGGIYAAFALILLDGFKSSSK